MGLCTDDRGVRSMSILPHILRIRANNAPMFRSSTQCSHMFSMLLFYFKEEPLHQEQLQGTS
jgi:hypothetical protein